MQEKGGGRFDFVWPGLFLAVEVEGLSRRISRHTTFAGFRGDCEKYNEAAILGWCVLRFTDKEIKSGSALSMIERAIEKANGEREQRQDVIEPGQAAAAK